MLLLWFLFLCFCILCFFFSLVLLVAPFVVVLTRHHLWWYLYSAPFVDCHGIFALVFLLLPSVPLCFLSAPFDVLHVLLLFFPSCPLPDRLLKWTTTWISLLLHYARILLLSVSMVVSEYLDFQLHCRAGCLCWLLLMLHSLFDGCIGGGFVWRVRKCGSCCWVGFFHSVVLDLLLTGYLVLVARLTCRRWDKQTTDGNGVTVPTICLLVWSRLTTSRQPKGMASRKINLIFLLDFGATGCWCFWWSRSCSHNDDDGFLLFCSWSSDLIDDDVLHQRTGSWRTPLFLANSVWILTIS